MSREEIRQAILDALAGVAPEGDYDRLKADRPLRDQLDIDSYDFLNVILALHERLGVDIPETDYQKLLTLNGTVDYLAAKVRAT